MDQRGGDLVSEKARILGGKVSDTDAYRKYRRYKIAFVSNKIIGKKAPGFSE